MAENKKGGFGKFGQLVDLASEEQVEPKKVKENQSDTVKSSDNQPTAKSNADSSLHDKPSEKPSQKRSKSKKKKVSEEESRYFSPFYNPDNIEDIEAKIRYEQGIDFVKLVKQMRLEDLDKFIGINWSNYRVGKDKTAIHVSDMSMKMIDLLSMKYNLSRQGVLNNILNMFIYANNENFKKLLESTSDDYETMSSS